MNRIEFYLLIKKTFGARYVQNEDEWRFRNGDQHYIFKASFENDRSTYEPHLDGVRLYQWMVHDARDDAAAHHVKSRFIADYNKDRMTRDEFKLWAVKAIITSEFS